MKLSERPRLAVDVGISARRRGGLDQPLARGSEAAAVEFDREQESSPTGRPRPSSLTEGMGQWDTTSRALSDKWGERRVTALGMRTVFVGWRALFAHYVFGARGEELAHIPEGQRHLFGDIDAAADAAVRKDILERLKP